MVRATLIPIYIQQLIQIETDGQSAASSGWSRVWGVGPVEDGTRKLKLGLPEASASKFHYLD